MKDDVRDGMVGVWYGRQWPLNQTVAGERLGGIYKGFKGQGASIIRDDLLMVVVWALRLRSRR
ncbi:hypothetical protein PIB30_083054, partial [Stylosanthes scabra]|nr:hypothetical protein [Stylosanthes scabra]